MKKYPLHITNHFNSTHSLKKRIVMLYHKQYSKKQLFRFALLLPVLFLSIFFFSFKSTAPLLEAFQASSQTTSDQFSSHFAQVIPPKAIDVSSEKIKADRKENAKKMSLEKVQKKAFTEFAKIEGKHQLNTLKPSIVSQIKLDTPGKKLPILTASEREILGSTAYFYKTSDVINSTTATMLNDMVTVLKKHPGIRLMIEGHTCNIAKTEDISQEITERRAKAVKQYFVSQSIHKDRLQTIGYGSKKPVASNETPFGRIRNRRVILKLIR